MVLKALAKHPGERYQSWEDFGRALSELVARQLVPLARLYEVKDSERFNLLRELEFFTDFGDVELWEVVHRARWRRYPLEHALYKKGQEGNSFHIIAQGEVQVFRDGALVASWARAPRWARWPIWHPTRPCAATAPTSR